MMSSLCLDSRLRIHSLRTVSRRPCIVRASQKNEDTSSRSLLSFLCPLLRVFSGGDLRTPAPRWREVATSGLASISRLPFGSEATASTASPPLPIRIYEFEACPFCRRVREAVTDLDLTVEIFPCPKNSLDTREEVQRMGGQLQFPFMVDDNTGKQLYESSDIVRYLYATYADSEGPPKGMLETTALTGWMPTVFRIGRGMSRFEGGINEPPKQLLQLYNYENNQFARLVHTQPPSIPILNFDISAGKGSRNREQLKDISGATTVPYLVDPNTGIQMGDSETIIQYLIENYTTPE